jgi:hypothetical protein
MLCPELRIVMCAIQLCSMAANDNLILKTGHHPHYPRSLP